MHSTSLLGNMIILLMLRPQKGTAGLATDIWEMKIVYCRVFSSDKCYLINREAIYPDLHRYLLWLQKMTSIAIWYLTSSTGYTILPSLQSWRLLCPMISCLGSTNVRNHCLVNSMYSVSLIWELLTFKTHSWEATDFGTTILDYHHHHLLFILLF